MKFALGNGTIAVPHLLAAMFGAKILGVISLSWWETSWMLGKNSATFMSRSCELLILLALVAAMYAPSRLPCWGIVMPSAASVEWRRVPLIAIAVVGSVVISRYAIEVIMIFLAVLFDPQVLEEARHAVQIAKGGIDALLADKTVAQLTIVPAVEELIYRGILLNVLLQRFRAIRALAISSLIFAVFHGNPVAAFLGGMLFGYIYFITGNILYSMLGHATANATVVLLYQFPSVVLPLSYEQMTSWPGAFWIWGTAVTWIVAFIALTMNYRKVDVMSAFPSATNAKTH